MKFIKNEILAKHTTLRIGGPADWFYEAKTRSQLAAAVKEAEKQKLTYKILGHGSNILVSDQGFRGLVIKNSSDKITILSNNQADLDSGVFLPKAIFYLIARGLTGLEVFSGIPATAGGATAVAMHGAGALWQNLILKIDAYHQVILGVTLQLQAGDPAEALTLAKKIQAEKQHQPQISCGCIWKNTNGKSTGAIIDQKLQLKGQKIGQAQISFKHANFIENLGGASSQDVLQLIELTRNMAKKQLGLDLSLEIEIWPD